MQTSMYMYSDRCYSSLTCLSACHICFLHPKPSPYLSALQCSDHPRRQRDRFILPSFVGSEWIPVTLLLSHSTWKSTFSEKFRMASRIFEVTNHPRTSSEFFRNLFGRLIRKRRLQKLIILNHRTVSGNWMKSSEHFMFKVFQNIFKQRKTRKFSEN